MSAAFRAAAPISTTGMVRVWPGSCVRTGDGVTAVFTLFVQPLFCRTVLYDLSALKFGRGADVFFLVTSAKSSSSVRTNESVISVSLERKFSYLKHNSGSWTFGGSVWAGWLSKYLRTPLCLDNSFRNRSFSFVNFFTSLFWFLSVLLKLSISCIRISTWFCNATHSSCLHCNSKFMATKFASKRTILSVATLPTILASWPSVITASVWLVDAISSVKLWSLIRMLPLAPSWSATSVARGVSSQGDGIGVGVEDSGVWGWVIFLPPLQARWSLWRLRSRLRSCFLGLFRLLGSPCRFLWRVVSLDPGATLTRGRGSLWLAAHTYCGRRQETSHCGLQHHGHGYQKFVAHVNTTQSSATGLAVSVD